MKPSCRAKPVLLWPEVSSSLWGRSGSINLLKGHAVQWSTCCYRECCRKWQDCHENLAVQMQKISLATLVIVLKKVLIKHMYLLHSGREVLLWAWNTACINLLLCVRELVLNGVRTTLAQGRRKAHFEARLVTLFFFLHHSFQIAARTWRELFPQALQPNVSTREAWVNSRSSGYESDGKDSALSARSEFKGIHGWTTKSRSLSACEGRMERSVIMNCSPLYAHF